LRDGDQPRSLPHDVTRRVPAHRRPAAPRDPAMRKRASVVKYAALSVFALISVGLPVWMVLVESAKDAGEAADLGLGLPHHWALVHNYATVLHEGHMLRGLRNTVMIALPSVAGTLILASFA